MIDDICALCKALCLLSLENLAFSLCHAFVSLIFQTEKLTKEAEVSFSSPVFEAIVSLGVIATDFEFDTIADLEDEAPE